MGLRRIRVGTELVAAALEKGTAEAVPDKPLHGVQVRGLRLVGNKRAGLAVELLIESPDLPGETPPGPIEWDAVELYNPIFVRRTP